MAIPKEIASIKRFGPRYGRTVKHKFGAVEAMHRKKYKCPICSKIAVKRVSTGIWQCEKCSSKFASKAYSFTKKRSIKEIILEMQKAEEKKETEGVKEKLEEVKEEKQGISS